MVTTEFSRAVNTSDILIIGGGVTGLTTAWNLAAGGVSVTVVDRRELGREASWAGAGMLPPGNLSQASTPEAKLRSYSHDLWTELSATLADRTGIDNGYRRCGAIETAGPFHPSLKNDIAAWRAEEIRFEMLDRTQLEQHVPDLAPTIQSGVLLPDFGQVRNPRHMKALATACRNAGVEIVEGCDALQLTDEGQGRVGVSSADRRFSFDRVCIAAGAWSSDILRALGTAIPVRPVRGQMVQLRVDQLPFSCVIEQGLKYLVPRTDGLILVGSTMESVGFEKKTTAQGIASLIGFAKSLVPDLGRAELVRCWAGLRPGSPDELPFLGAVPGFENLLIAAGHFRSGLQMSPATGAIMADLLLDRTPAIDLDGLDFSRAVPTVSEPFAN